MRLSASSGLRWLLFGLCASACSAEKTEPLEAVRSNLEGGAVARVDGRDIAPSIVRDIALAQGVDPRTAVDRAVFDALLAREAEARGLDAAHARALSRSHVRPLLDALAEEARAEGPPTDEELGVSVRREWFKVARPAAVVTVHAIAMVDPGADEATWERATRLAGAIRDAVAPAVEEARSKDGPVTDFDERGALPADPLADVFIEEAKKVPTGEVGGNRVRVERVEPLAAVGGSVSPNGRSDYDPEYVRAAVALESRGDLSAPIRSSHGVHVILALGWTPASELSRAELVDRYGAEVIDRRVRTKVDAIIAKLESEALVKQDRTVDQLLEQVQVLK